MDKLKIIIISRLIKPALSPRAFRTTELAKELSRQGHHVTVYAVLGKFDYSLFESETGVKVRNIGKMFFGSSDSEGNHRYTLFDKVLYHSLHRLIEYPDIELMLRIPKIIRKEVKTDLLITVAHPHPIHWGAALSKLLNTKYNFPKLWISDCGDPYMGDPINRKKIFYFKYIEKWWGNKTDYITIPLEAGKYGYYNEVHSKIKVIPQGFDFSKIQIVEKYIKNDVPTFAYSGSIYIGQRDPRSFLNFLITLNFEFKFVIYTKNPDYYAEFKKLLDHKLEIRSYIQREELIYQLSKMDFLINLKNPNIVQLPSKLIDYLQAKRPIMDISSEFPTEEQSTFLNFINGNYKNQLKAVDLEEFNIKNIAQKFIELFYEGKRKES